jgi:hypothetical protein
MTYHQLITRAVDELNSDTEEARRALYERARTALLAQLRSNKHVLVLADITRQRRALEEAIGKVEADAGRLRQDELPMAGHKFLPRRPGGSAPIDLWPPCRKMDGPPCFSAPASVY